MGLKQGKSVYDSQIDSSEKNFVASYSKKSCVFSFVFTIQLSSDEKIKNQLLGKSGWNQIQGNYMYTHRGMTLGSITNAIWPLSHQQYHLEIYNLLPEDIFHNFP